MSQTQFTYTWDLTKFETTAKLGPYEEVITRIYWTLTGSDDKGNSAPLYDNTEISLEWILAQHEPFLPFSEMTKDQCEELLETVLGEDEITRLTDNLKIQVQQIEETQITARAAPWLTA
jgi:hypothetical protein